MALVLPLFQAMDLFFSAAALFLAAPLSESRWLGWVYLLLGLLWPVAIWGSYVSWIEVGPDRLVVHHHSRTRAVPMDDIEQVEAHRHWPGPSGLQAPPYWLLIRRRSGGRFRVPYIELEAGDRVLFALHRLGKRVWVFAWH